jgi:hypothetical protein
MPRKRTPADPGEDHPGASQGFSQRKGLTMRRNTQPQVRRSSKAAGLGLMIASWLCLAGGPAFGSQAFWIGAGSPRNDGTSYQAINGNYNCSFDATYVRQVLPGGGALGKLYVWSSADPGGSASWTVRVRKNGTNTSLKAIVNSGETSDVNEVPGGVSFNAGDTIEYLITPASSPATAAVYTCLVYSPTTPSHCYLMCCYYFENNKTFPIGPVGPASGNGDCRVVFPVAGTVHGRYGWCAAVPGAGTTRTMTTSLYATSWAAQTQTITFGESDTAASDTDPGHEVSVAAGNWVRLIPGYTGTPANSHSAFSLDFVTADGSFPLFWSMTYDTVQADGYVNVNSTGTDNATESNRLQKVTACTLKSLYVVSSGSPGSLESFTFTVRDDGSDTALTAAITGTGTTANYSTDVGVELGSALSTFVDLSAGASTSRKMFTGILVSLAKDTRGGNDLTNVTDHEATVDTTHKQEGAAAADFEAGTPCYMTIADAALDTGFPLKSGDTNKKISVCFWIKPESVPTTGNTMYLFSKWDEGNSKRSFAILIVEDSGSHYITLEIGRNSGANYLLALNPAVSISADSWYHVACTYNDSNRRYSIRVYVLSSQATGAVSGCFPDNMSITDAPVYLGASADLSGSYYDGILDEVVVFKDIITSVEADDIAAITYTGPSTGGGGGSIFHSVVE